MRNTLVFIFCLFTYIVSAQQRENFANTTKFKGNTFSWSAPIIDSIHVIDPNTGNEKFYVKSRMPIIKMNEQAVKNGDISNSNTLQHDGYQNNHIANILENIQQALSRNSARFPKEIKSVLIKNIVINTDGSIVYYDVETTSDNSLLSGDNKSDAVNILIDNILSIPYIVNPNNASLESVYYIERLPKEVEIN